MDMILSSLSSPFWNDVFWTLLHSVWQAALIATILIVCLSLLPARRTRLRYGLAYGALILVVLTSAITHGVISSAGHHGDVVATVAAQAENVNTSRRSPNVSQTADLHGSHHDEVSVSPVGFVPKFKELAIKWQPILIAFWLGITLLLLVRNLVSVFRAAQLLPGTKDYVPAQIGQIFEEVKQRLGCPTSTRLRLSNSTSLLSPYVVGIVQATVVVPVAMLTQLTSDEIESVLAHEIAHIMRHDFLFNLVQLAIGSLYFFNPAVYFLNRQICSEREACCDDVAVRATTNDVAYAETLTKYGHWILENSKASAPSIAMSFTGSQRGKLFDRVSRLLIPEKSPSSLGSAWGFVVVLLITFLVMFTASSGTQAVASYTATLIQESEMRAGEIEELKDSNSIAGYKKGTAKLKLRIVTEDGVPLKKGSIHITSLTGAERNMGSGTSMGLKKRTIDHEYSFLAGKVSVLVEADGYAPNSVMNGVEVTAGEVVEKEITLKFGESSKIRVVDEDGNPVVGAAIRRHIKSSVSSSSTLKTGYLTDRDGRATVENLDKDVVDYVSISKTGYIIAKPKNLFTGVELEVVLKETPLTFGVVVDSLGNRVPNAKIFEFESIRFDREHAHPIAVSGDDGWFETVELSPGRHNLLVEANDERGVAIDVVAGDQVKLKLAEPRSITVKIEGDLDLLDRDSLRVRQYYRPQLGMGRGYHYLSFSVPCDFRLPTDREFTIKGVVSGSLTIDDSRIGGSGRLYYNEKIDDLDEIVLNLKRHETEKRKAHIVFECEGKRVFPQGTVKIRRKLKRENAWGIEELKEVKNGKAEALVEKDEIRVESGGLTGFAIIDSDQVARLKEDEFVVNVEPAGAIQGIVLDAEGNPVSTEVSAHFEFLDERRRSSFLYDVKVFSNAEGKFLLTPIPLGTRVKVRAGDRMHENINEVIVDAKNPVVKTRFRMPQIGSATIRVIDVGGSPVPKMLVNVRLNRIGYSRGQYTDENGESSFKHLKVGEEEYLLTVEPNSGYQVPVPQKIFVDDSIDVVLKEGHRLSGKVVDVDGKPVHEFVVKALFDDRFVTADYLTNKGGEFVFTRLPNKPVKLQAAHRWEQVKSPISESFKPNEDDEIVLTVKGK